jgi:hypothetical protein
MRADRRPSTGWKRLLALAGAAALTGGWLTLALAGPIAAQAEADQILPGGVVAWGDPIASTVPAQAKSGIVAIAAGGEHALALTSGSQVVAWGLNDHGQTNVPADLGKVTKIAAGQSFSVALKADGSVVAWGDDSEHQTDVPAAARSGVVDVAAGGGTVVALKSDGSIVVWGDNCCGQTILPASLAGLSASPEASATPRIKSISVSRQILAVTSNGSVLAWGDNSFGQGVVPSNLTQATAVAAGGDFSLALRPVGSVVGWGDDTYHETDVPCASPSTTSCAVPVADFTQIAAGGHHALAVKQDGTVVAWGLDSAGQTNVPRTLSAVEAIAAGADFSMALTSLTTPFPPIFVSAWAGNGSATISWVAPYDGRSPITGFVAFATPGGKTCRTDGTGISCTIDGLTNGQPYTFTVAARNALGSSAASPATAPVTPSLLATAPPATPRPTPTSPPGSRAVPAPVVPPPDTTLPVAVLTTVGLVSLAIGLGLPRRLIRGRRTVSG